MPLPLGLLDERDVSRRLRVLAALSGLLDLRVVESAGGTDATALLQAVRVRAPRIVVVGDDGRGRAERVARCVRTDLRAEVALVVLGSGPHARPFRWSGERRPPDGWVADVRDPDALGAVVRAVLAGGCAWPAEGDPRDVPAASWLSRTLARAKRARMRP